MFKTLILQWQRVSACCPLLCSPVPFNNSIPCERSYRRGTKSFSQGLHWWQVQVCKKGDEMWIGVTGMLVKGLGALSTQKIHAVQLSLLGESCCRVHTVNKR